MCLCGPCIQDASGKLLPSRDNSLSPEHQQHCMPQGIIHHQTFSQDSDDDSPSTATIKHKMVAIDTTQNEHFIIDFFLVSLRNLTTSSTRSCCSFLVLLEAFLFLSFPLFCLLRVFCLFVCLLYLFCVFGSDYTHSLTRCLLLGSC